MTPLEALQAALAGEHAAVYLYGVLGARSSRSAQPELYGLLVDGFRIHRKRRDQLTEMIHGHSAEPIAAEVSYDLTELFAGSPSGSAPTPGQLRDAALLVERRTAGGYGQLIEGTAGDERRWALVALDECAARQLELRGSPEHFPGLTP